MASFTFHRSFKVQPLATHLKPVGKKSLTSSDAGSSGPFIFSSLRRNVKQTKAAKSKAKKGKSNGLKEQIC